MGASETAINCNFVQRKGEWETHEGEGRVVAEELGGGREMRERGGWRESAACLSNGWAGKGVYAVPPGLGIALRAEPARREFARGASLSSFPRSLFLFAPLPPPFPLSSSPPVLPVLSLFPTPFLLPPFRRDRPTFLSARFCGNPSGTFSYRCYSATCRIRRFPTADRNNSACCFRPACLSNGTASSESHGTFLNTFANIVAPPRWPDANSSSKYLAKKKLKCSLFFSRS